MDNPIIKLSELPIGRIGRFIAPNYPHDYLYIAYVYESKDYPNSSSYLQIWPGNTTLSGEPINRSPGFNILRKEGINETMAKWQLELLPENTSVTLLFNGGERWQKS